MCLNLICLVRFGSFGLGFGDFLGLLSMLNICFVLVILDCRVLYILVSWFSGMLNWWMYWMNVWMLLSVICLVVICRLLVIVIVMQLRLLMNVVVGCMRLERNWVLKLVWQMLLFNLWNCFCVVVWWLNVLIIVNLLQVFLRWVLRCLVLVQ